MRDFVPELARLPLLFRETFRTRAETLKNGATLVGTGTTFGGDGVTFNGSGNLRYAASGAQILRASRSIVITFTLGFAGNDGVLHYFFDYATVAGAGQFSVTKDAANAIVVAVGGVAVLTVAYATWNAALVAGKNKLIVSTVTGATTAWLNGTSIGTSAVAWVAVTGMQVFAIGASYANGSRFVGTIHSFEIYGSVATSVDEPLLRAGNLVEGVDFSKALAYLSGHSYYRRSSDGLYVTDVGGKGTVSQALMGGDGSTLAQMPSIIRPNGFSFDGGDQINFGNNAQFSFTDGVADKPFSLSCLVSQTLAASQSVIAKSSGIVLGEYNLYLNVIAGVVVVELFLIDETAGAAIGRYGSLGVKLISGLTPIVATYSGGGITGIRIYAYGVRIDTTNYTTGVYVRMRNTARSLRSGNDDSGLTPMRGNVVLPAVWDLELSPFQGRALSARMLWEARRS
jgi:hypothetical protein